MFNKLDTPLIEFVCDVEGLTGIEDVLPRKTNTFVPDWWKNIPRGDRDASKFSIQHDTVKRCPSFPDYFSQGFVVPAWADMVIKYDDAIKRPFSRIGRQETFFPITDHPSWQFLDHVTPSVFGVEAQWAFKLNSPWRLITPKGYSTLQLPLLYHFTSDYSVLPGIVNTDSHHQINIQFMYHGKGKEVFIPRGTPLVQYIPFKRIQTEMVIREQTEQDKKRFAENDLEVTSLFTGAYSRRSKRKNA